MKFYFWAVFYKISLEVVYAKTVSPIYENTGLIWNPNFKYLALSYFIFFILLLLIPKGKDKPSNQLSQLLFFTTVVPLLCFFWQTSTGLQYVLYVTICFTFLFLFLRFIKPIKIQFIQKSKKPIDLVNLIFIVSIIILFLLKFKTGGIDTRALNFANIYEMRQENSFTGIWVYLINWVSKLFIPFCIVVFMINKKTKLLFFSIMMQTYMYLCTGSKTILFSIVLLIGCTYLLKKGKWLTGVPKMYSLIIIVSTMVHYLIGNAMAIAIFPTRQLIIPAQISIIHYNFFSTGYKLYLSEGMIGKIFNLQSQYDTISTFLVSSTAGVNSNTGFLGDAFDNGGLLFMLFYILILAMILLLIDSISRNSEQRYKYTALSVYSIVILNDGPLLTTLFTWGLGLLLVFMYLMASQENKSEIVLPVKTEVINI